MYSGYTYRDVQAMVATELDNDETQPIIALAETLGLTEGEVTFALPAPLVTTGDASQTETLLNRISDWGPMTTIVHSHGSIFEFKGPFPKGKTAQGYYNIMGKEGLNGHLKLDLIHYLAFVSKPFRGLESHYIGFYDEAGHCVFKTYLGRTPSRHLFPEQITKYQELKKELAQPSPWKTPS